MRQTISILLLLLACISLDAQTLEDAKKLYIKGRYSEALPIFEKEYVLKPNDPALNQWLGVCLYKTKKDISRAEELLTFASKKKIRDSFYYLAHIHATNFKVEAALSNLDLYQKELKRTYGKTKAQIAVEKTLLADSEILKDKINNLQRMILHTQDVVIVDSVVVKKENILQAYHLSPLIGELIYSGEIFSVNNLDDAYTTVFFTENRNKAYYSQPDSIGIHNIYSMDKLADGTFGNKKVLFPDRFGFEGDMKYPYVLSDGVTILFAGQEKQGIAGLSLYITRLNTLTNKYLKPEELNTPFNSFSNDYLYVVDDYKQIAWFATDRNTKDGYVTVYTFVPTTNTKMIDSNDSNYLANRAFISSIRDTWETDKDYSSVIALAKEDIPVAQKINKDFTFVVYDNKAYYNLDDFKSAKARDIYRQVINLQKRLNHIQDSLNEQREMLAIQNKTSMEQRDILVMENEVLALQKQIDELENNARKLEINN